MLGCRLSRERQFFSFRDIPASFTDWSPSDPRIEVGERSGSDVLPNMWR
jgi:hypothetical protein